VKLLEFSLNDVLHSGGKHTMSRPDAVHVVEILNRWPAADRIPTTGARGATTRPVGERGNTPLTPAGPTEEPSPRNGDTAANVVAETPGDGGPAGQTDTLAAADSHTGGEGATHGGTP
jgi:hypothetical protein